MVNVVVVALVLLIVILVIFYLVDRVTVGGHGIWHGHEEPPEWFEGFWGKGHVILQWPTPGLVVEGDLIEEDIRVQSVFEDMIVVNELSADRIVASSITTEDITHAPYNLGVLTTKQELARRRSGEK